MATKDFDNIMDMYFRQTKPSKSTEETKITVKEDNEKKETVQTEQKTEKKPEVKNDVKTTPRTQTGTNKGGRKPYKDSDGTPPVRLNTKLYNGNYDYCLQKGMEAGIKPCNAISYYINHLIDIDKKKHTTG